MCWVYILLWHPGFPGGPQAPHRDLGASARALLRSLGARAGGDKNIPGILSHLVAPLRSLLTGCGAWLLVWGWRWSAAVLCVMAGNLAATGGGKDSSGTIDVDDKVTDLGMQLKRGKGSKRDVQLGPQLGYFWSPGLMPSLCPPLPCTLSPSTSVWWPTPSGLSNNNSIIPLCKTVQTQWNKPVNQPVVSPASKNKEVRSRLFQKQRVGGLVPKMSQLASRSAERSIFRSHQTRQYKNSPAQTLSRSVSHA